MVITKRSRGIKVEKLQYRLGIVADGIFGDGTERMVAMWQEDNGLQPTGEMRNLDWQKMFGCDISDWTPIGIVVHSMSEYIQHEGERKYAKDFLNDIGLSVHGLITPNGKFDGMRPTDKRALHAGVSEWRGLEGLNNYFLGFEVLLKGNNSYGEFLESIQQNDAFAKEQFDAAVLATKMWMGSYNIPAKDVVRHSDISGDDIRGKGKGKVDPGSGWDWNAFKKEIQ